MPPVRKNSKTIEDLNDGKIKPMKTVRTHEENQERAYVAASRRSDRSLEARIESARRASEIHKKRTGRAFRITEEDVLNEQYYEEVDDDIPASIRRLQMHLNGLYHWNNPRFDSYMISNYAKHHAAWIAQRFGQQGNSQYANPPIFSNSFGQVPPGMPGNTGSPSGGPTSPSLPQQTPGQQAQGSHQRSASVAGPSGAGLQQPPFPFGAANGELTEEQRRFSLPVQTSQAIDGAETRPSLSRSASGSEEGANSRFTASPTTQQMTGFPGQSMNTTCQPQQMMNGQNFDNMGPAPGSFGPFSPTMALNVQQLWDGSNNMMSMPYFGDNMGYQYNPNAGSSKSQNQNQAFNHGIHQTLTGNPLGMTGMDTSAMPNQGSKAVTPGSGPQFDNFWAGDASQGGANMGTDFEGFFNFPSSSDEHGNGDNFLEAYTNVNDDIAVTEQ